MIIINYYIPILIVRTQNFEVAFVCYAKLGIDKFSLAACFPYYYTGLLIERRLDVVWHFWLGKTYPQHVLLGWYFFPFTIYVVKMFSKVPNVYS